LGEEWLLAVGFGACDGMVGVLLQCELFILDLEPFLLGEELEQISYRPGGRSFLSSIFRNDLSDPEATDSSSSEALRSIT
jgi:hypothetical protein